MTLALRQYQRDAVDGLNRWLETHRQGNPLVVIPTAGGKSLIIGTFIQKALGAWPDTRVIVLTHVKELIAQNYAELIGFWPDAPAGIYSAGLGKRDLRSRILFAGIQSIYRKAYDLQRVDLVLVDEAHLIPRSAETTYGRFLADLRQINPHLCIVGFTATPFRLDSGRLHEGDGALFSDIAYEVSMRELIEQGFLCPPISGHTLARINTDGIRTVAGEFNSQQLEAAATDPDVVEGIVKEVVAAGENRRGWIVFGVGLEHCTMLRDGIRALGVSCEAIFGNTQPGERDRLIRDFKAQRIRCLVSVGVLTTGFNAKHVDLIAIARPTKSTSLYVQMIGRGTRLFPGKENCLVLDFGGNIERHGPVDAPTVKRPGAGGGEMPTKPCADRVIGGEQIEGCGADNLIAAVKCCGCGAPFARESKVDTKASARAVLSSHIAPEWVEVSSVSYRRHENPGKTPSLCVTYMCGFVAHREWVCLEHPGLPRSKAVTWWLKRTRSGLVPNTVNEALVAANALLQPEAIQIRPVGKFVEIVSARFASVSGKAA